MIEWIGNAATKVVIQMRVTIVTGSTEPADRILGFKGNGAIGDETAKHPER